MPIPNVEDRRLDDYRDLRTPAHRVELEESTGIFIAEGVTVVRRLLQSHHRVRSVLVLESRVDRVRDLVPDHVPLLVVDRQTMNAVVGFDLHRGVLACADRPPWSTIDDIVRTSRVIGVLEGLNDHENLGAIARTARALGVDALVLDPTTADPWYRRCVRVSMGEIMFVPLVRATEWPSTLDLLRGAGFVVAALTPAPDAVDLAAFAGTPPERVAVMLGAEGPGLSVAALAAADIRIRIPIHRDVDSLNVGHAAAIAFAALGGAPPSSGPPTLPS